MKIQSEQSPEEEHLNTITHGIGLIIAVISSIFLLVKCLQYGIHLRFFAYLTYSLGLVTLYLASTLYHGAKNPERKRLLNIFDHASIYLLIAGTYTPITLLCIKGIIGTLILCTVWVIAIVGIILKLYFTGRYSRISTAAYVMMGWVILIAIKPLVNTMELLGLYWLVAGGIFYTLGALIYLMKSMKYNHVIFHLFVLFGSLCHYIVVLNYT